MLLGDATDPRRRIVPPLLIEQERWINQIVWPLLPCFAAESAVLRQRLDARLRSLFLVALQSTLPSMIGEADRLSHSLIGELKALAGRKREMRGPVKMSVGQCCRPKPP
jgi:hypothetical protein